MLGFPLSFPISRATSHTGRAHDDEDNDRREAARDPEPTAVEAHIAWFAGAPYAQLADRHGETVRFVSLLVPFT